MLSEKNTQEKKITHLAFLHFADMEEGIFFHML